MSNEQSWEELADTVMHANGFTQGTALQVIASAIEVAFRKLAALESQRRQPTEPPRSRKRGEPLTPEEFQRIKRETPDREISVRKIGVKDSHHRYPIRKLYGGDFAGLEYIPTDELDTEPRRGITSNELAEILFEAVAGCEKSGFDKARELGVLIEE